jgi:hypothetical protein
VCRFHDASAGQVAGPPSGNRRRRLGGQHNCVGASSLRSYAILTSSNGDTDDVVAYYGVTKVF